MSQFVQHLGLKSSQYEESIHSEGLNEFLRVVSGNIQEPLVYSGEAHEVATYYTRFRFGEFEILDQMGVELKNVLHGEQEYQYHYPLCPGDQLKYETVFSSVSSKKTKGFWMHIFTFDTPVTRVSDGRILVNSITTFIVRYKDEESATEVSS